MDRIKPWWLYWFWRVYVITTWLIMMFVIGNMLFTLRNEWFRYVLWGSPFYVVAVIAACSYFAFPFDYSIFGKYRRTPLPAGPPQSRIKASSNSWAIAGNSMMGPVTWLFYTEGLGLQSSFGSVYLPHEQIDGLDLMQGYDRAFYRRKTSTLYHHSPEVREPIFMRKEIAEVVARHYPDKVLADVQES